MQITLDLVRKCSVKRLFSFVALCCFSATLNAVEFGSATVAEVRTIYDGDTFRVNIAGWPSVVGDSMPVRIKGIDTPELRGKCQLE
ncbi:MAG: endonuclease YncB(thermonuclease family), partial [Zhongshania sp.]